MTSKPPASADWPPVEDTRQRIALGPYYKHRSADRNWFAEGAIEGNPVILMAGPEKTHKSWAALDLACKTVRQGSWLGAFPIKRSGPVVFFDGEYGPTEFARRYARIAAGMVRRDADVDDVDALISSEELVYFYSKELLLSATDTYFRSILEQVKEIQPALIVVDPLRNHLKGDENSAPDVLAAFKALGMMRDAARCPVLAVHHLNKSGSFNGSRALVTRADLIIEGTDAENPTYTARGRTFHSKDAILGGFAIEMSHDHDDEELIAKTYVTATLGTVGKSGAGSLGDRVMAALNAKPGVFFTADAIARELLKPKAAKRNSVLEAMKPLIEDGFIIVDKPGKYLEYAAETDPKKLANAEVSRKMSESCKASADKKARDEVAAKGGLRLVKNESPN